MDNEKLAKQILKENQKNYNLIADEFSQTRNFISNNFKNWIKNYIAEGEKILDWGCGNGRFYELFLNNDYHGIDFSEKMIAIAQNKYPFGNFKTCLPTIIPYSNDFFDKIFHLRKIFLQSEIFGLIGLNNPVSREFKPMIAFSLKIR